MNIRLADAVHLVRGRLLCGDESLELAGFATLEEAGPGDLSFFGNARYLDDFRATRAGAVLVPPDLEERPSGVALIEVENPVVAFDQVVRSYGAPEIAFAPGIHPRAEVSPEAEFDPDGVRIDAFAVVEAGAKIGEGSWVGANCFVGRDSRLGKECRLHPLVSLRDGTILGDRVVIHGGSIIGADGYGYELEDGRHRKIRQAGIVEIGDDVEIGAGTTIDRARFGTTQIGEGTKIDNLVQIGHNVRIGRHCLIVAQTGISGSVRIEDYVTVAAQNGIGGHLHIGEKAVLGARCGVIADLEGEETYFGYPAKPLKEWTRRQMHVKRIPALLRRIEELEQRLADLEREGS